MRIYFDIWIQTLNKFLTITNHTRWVKCIILNFRLFRSQKGILIKGVVLPQPKLLDRFGGNILKEVL